MASALRVQVSPSAYFLGKLTKQSIAATNKASISIVFVSNGPGELSTWVRPLAENLHKKILMRPRGLASPIALNLVLVPCPNATGQEENVARNWELFDCINPAKSFWKLLLWPKNHGHWPNNGLVVFLGGDQFWSVLLSARLGYSHITYAEWVARWPQWNDRIAAMSASVKAHLPSQYQHRCAVVGDLMADLSLSARSECPMPNGEWIALLPGSKRAKLSIGVPFMLEFADYLAGSRPGCQFLLFVAPTTNIHELQHYGSSENPIANEYFSKIERFSSADQDKPWPKVVTSAGTEIFLERNHPSYNSLSQCDLALTTVGANTAELGALGVPMIVIVPTQHLEVMQAWDGFLGLLARTPGIRWFLGILVTAWRLRKKGFLAWPNIAAGRMVVPERVGTISPQQIASEAEGWLSSPERLNGQREDLRRLRGSLGAIEALSLEIRKLLPRAMGFKEN